LLDVLDGKACGGSTGGELEAVEVQGRADDALAGEMPRIVGVEEC
jgi:hypothetical protein